MQKILLLIIIQKNYFSSMKKPREKSSEQKPNNALTFSLRLDKVRAPKFLKLQVLNSMQERIVIPRPKNAQNFKQINQCMIKSLNISRHNIEDEEPKQVNLQFNKKLKVNQKTQGHARTCSHQCQKYNQNANDQILSDFSNSLENISSQIIEIPFANKTITQKNQKMGQKQQKNKLVLIFDRKNSNSLKRSLHKQRSGSEQTRRNVKKISYSKQNYKTPAQKTNNKPQAYMIPKPKKIGNLQSKLSLSDFSLKAIKITRSGAIIYMAIHSKTGTIYALKSIRKSKTKSRLNEFMLELKLGLYANHPNITKIYGLFEEGDYIYLIKEYLQQGSLVDEQKGLSEMMISQYINQLIFGVLRLSSLVNLEFWHLTSSQMCKSNDILKITKVHLSEANSSQIFSEQLKKVVQYILQFERRQTLELTLETLASSRYSFNPKFLAKFTELLQKILIINQNTLYLLWQHPFLKQSRFKAIMVD